MSTPPLYIDSTSPAALGYYIPPDLLDEDSPLATVGLSPHLYQYPGQSPFASSSTLPALGSSIGSDDMSTVYDGIRFPRPTGLTVPGGRVKAAPHVGDLLGAPSELSRRTTDNGGNTRQETVREAHEDTPFATTLLSPSVRARLPTGPSLRRSSMGPAYYEMSSRATADQITGSAQFSPSSTSATRRQRLSVLPPRNGNSPSLHRNDPLHTHMTQDERTLFDAAATGWQVEGGQASGLDQGHPLFRAPYRPSHHAVPIIPPATAPPTDSIERTGDTLLANGLTGYHLRDLHRGATRRLIPFPAPTSASPDTAISPSPTSSALVGSLPSSFPRRANSQLFSLTSEPSVPPPRPSARSLQSRSDHDRLDFSPSRRDLLEDVHSFLDRYENYQRNSLIASPPRPSHMDRLQRLDALRTGGDPHMLMAEGWSWRYGGTDGQSQTMSRSLDTSNRFDRYDSHEQRDLRSRIRPSSPEEIDQTSLSRLHRSVQDAIGRRVSGDAPHSPTSSARRHREITGPYPRPPSTSRRAQDGRQGLFGAPGVHERPRPYQQPTPPSRLDSHVAREGGEELQGGPLLPLSFGWREFGAFTDPTRASSGHQRISSSDEPWLTDPGTTEGWSDTASDSSADLRQNPHRSLSALSMRLLHICPTMDEGEQVKIARNIARTARQLPESVRKQAVKSAVTSVPWMAVTIPGTEKDASCSICHDDVGHIEWPTLCEKADHVVRRSHDDRRHTL